MERFEKPTKVRRCDSDSGWSVSHLFSKFAPLRRLFDNHYTVGTEISTLYQTEH